MLCEIDSFQNDYVFKAVFSYSHPEVGWLKPTKIKKYEIEDIDNCNKVIISYLSTQWAAVMT